MKDLKPVRKSPCASTKTQHSETNKYFKINKVIHTEETRSERDTCTPMFIAALFIIARTWKQPRCPTADKWIRKHGT